MANQEKAKLALNVIYFQVIAQQPHPNTGKDLDEVHSNIYFFYISPAASMTTAVHRDRTRTT